MDLVTILTVALPLVMLGVEYWLGKAKIPKANSILELIETMLKRLLEVFSKKEE